MAQAQKKPPASTTSSKAGGKKAAAKKTAAQSSAAQASEAQTSTSNAAASSSQASAPDMASAAAGILEGVAEATTDVQGAIDVALAVLSQSYAHSLSQAFHDAVLDRQRRAIVAQAAMTRALVEIQGASPEAFQEQLAQVRSGLDLLTAGDDMGMGTFTGLSEQFQVAVENLARLRNNLAKG